MSTDLAQSGNEQPIVIAIMGPTGSGKTTFVNTASESELEIGHNLTSCTEYVQMSQVITFKGRKVTLVDTPGFDDTNKSDTDILRNIALWLATTYEAGLKLSGVIYMHRIMDVRVNGVTRRNFKLFRDLCGETALVNVVIVTTRWDVVTPEEGERRERELATGDQFFKPALDKGARMVRYEGTRASAHAVLDLLLNARPQPLKIQKELVDEQKSLDETAAAASLGKELAEQNARLRVEIAALREEMEAARVTRDRETEAELAQVRAELVDTVRRSMKETAELRERYARDKQRTDEEMAKMKELIEAQHAARDEREAQVTRLEARLDEAAKEANAEREKAKKYVELCTQSLPKQPSPFLLALETLANLTTLCRYSMAMGGHESISSLISAASKATNPVSSSGFTGVPSNGTLPILSGVSKAFAAGLKEASF